MKTLIFGDLHFNPKNEISMLRGLNFLDYVKKYCLENNIKNVVNLGDTLHHNNVKGSGFVRVFSKFLELKESGINIYTILGNHDIHNIDNSDTLPSTFRSFSTFIQKEDNIQIGNLECDFLSYTENVEDLPNKGRILFTHLGVKGFMFSGSKMDEKSNFEYDDFDQYDLVISGHLHTYQEKGNMLFIGSPFQQDFGDVGKKSYFAILHDNGSVEKVLYDEGPEYMVINAEDFNDGYDYTNKILKVLITKKIENFVKLKTILFNKGALEVNPEFIKEDTIIETKTSIDINEGVLKSAVKYLKDIKDKNIDNKRLLACFKNVLKECQ